jgi:hypothetical protein
MKMFIGIILVLLLSGGPPAQEKEKKPDSKMMFESALERRAWEMADCLNKYRVHTIVVLYEGTEYGIGAERAFRSQLRGLQKKRYLSLPYDPADRGRKEIRRILELRPEAVGIFGGLKNIAPVYRMLKIFNTGWPRYLPLTFSLTDTRSIEYSSRNNCPVLLTGKMKNGDFKLEKTIGVINTIRLRLKHIWNSVGFYLVFNLFLVIVVCLVFCMWDIIRWYVGKNDWKVEIRSLFRKGHFWILVSANFIVTLFFYGYLGETGGIRYDSPLSAFILSLSLSAILRVPPGKHYDNFTLYIYGKIATYSQSDINRIAYYNNVESMRLFLEEISPGIPDRERRIRMRVSLEEILKDTTKKELDVRKSLACLLLQYPLWEPSVTHANYPEEFQKIDFDNLPRDPEKVIDRAAHFHYSENGEKEKQIEKQIKKQMNKLKNLLEKSTSPGRIDWREYSRLNKHLEKIKRSSVYNMREKITVLFLLKEFEFLKKEDLLRKSWDTFLA